MADVTQRARDIRLLILDVDGVLTDGGLYIGPDGMRCASRNSQPSLRLIAVDYADINGDGYLDAVLRFVPIGPGAARSPLILPLTRTSPDGAFETPQQPSIGP